MPGIESRLALLYTFGVGAGPAVASNAGSRCAAPRPPRLFGLAGRKGALIVGADADVVIFDPEREVTCLRSMLHENCDYTPYEGYRLKGIPCSPCCAAVSIARDGEFQAADGFCAGDRFLDRGRLHAIYWAPLTFCPDLPASTSPASRRSKVGACASSATGSSRSRRTPSCDRPTRRTRSSTRPARRSLAGLRGRAHPPVRRAGPRHPAPQSAVRFLAVPHRFLVAAGGRPARPRDDLRGHRPEPGADAARGHDQLLRHHRGAERAARLPARPGRGRRGPAASAASSPSRRPSGSARRTASSGCARTWSSSACDAKTKTNDEGSASFVVRLRLGPAHVLPHHLHLLGGLHPAGVRDGCGRRRVGAHARVRGDVRAGACAAQLRWADFRVLRPAGRGRAEHAGVAVRPDHARPRSRSSPPRGAGDAHAALELRGGRRHRAGARPARTPASRWASAATATSPICSR